MNFKEWVIKLKYDNGEIGDLAKDIERDEMFPLTKEKDEIINYFNSLSASPKAIDVFNYLWVHYIRSGN